MAGSGKTECIEREVLTPFKIVHRGLRPVKIKDIEREGFGTKEDTDGPKILGSISFQTPKF